MSTYPTSADLAAFRRRIAARHCPGFSTYTPMPFGPHQLGDRPWIEAQPNGTELRHGIPASYDRSGHGTDRGARRRAAQDRHEAYERLWAEALGDAGLALDMADAVDRYAGSPPGLPRGAARMSSRDPLDAIDPDELTPGQTYQVLRDEPGEGETWILARFDDWDPAMGRVAIFDPTYGEDEWPRYHIDRRWIARDVRPYTEAPSA